MAKDRYDSQLVEAILSGQDSPASRWVRDGGGGLDALSADEALAAIEAARQLGSGARLLEAKGARDKAVRKAAGAALHRLKAGGVAVEAAPQPVVWRPREGMDDLPEPVAMLGMPDPTGYFPFLLVSFKHDESCASAGLAGAGQGFTDSDHAHLSRSEARDVVAKARREQDMTPVFFYEGLHFVESAFSQGGNRPHGFDHLLGGVPEGVRASARLLDPLEAEETELSRDALHDITPLQDARLTFLLSEDRIEGALGEVQEILGSQLDLDEDSRRRRLQDAIDGIADRTLTGAVRRTWTLAMDVATFLAGKQGNDPLRRAARHAALALRQDVPGRDIPFFRQSVELQLQFFIAMLSGNEAALGAMGGLPPGELGDLPVDEEGNLILDNR